MAPAGGPLFVLPRGRLAVLGAVARIAFMAASGRPEPEADRQAARLGDQAGWS